MGAIIAIIVACFVITAGVTIYLYRTKYMPAGKTLEEQEVCVHVRVALLRALVVSAAFRSRNSIGNYRYISGRASMGTVTSYTISATLIHRNFLTMLGVSKSLG